MVCAVANEFTEADQVKIYKTTADKKWYDKFYSEEAGLNSPEFGIAEVKAEIKKAIDTFEPVPVGA